MRDENGVTYTGAFVPRKRTRYPLASALPIVDAWDRDHPNDLLRPRLVIGASEFNELAKAREKRPDLAGTLSRVAEIAPYSEFQISTEAHKPKAKKAKARDSTAV